MPGRLNTRSLTFPFDHPHEPINQDHYPDPSPRYHYHPSRQGTHPSPLPAAMEDLKRRGLAALGKQKNKDKTDKKSNPTHASKSAKPTTNLGISAESPPAIFYGNANNSSGALYAGQLQLQVVEPELTLTSLTMRLTADISTRKPVTKDCPDCIAQSTELKTWTFLTQPKRYTQGIHTLPFSYLFPGHLPAATPGELGQVHYFLHAKGTKASTSTPSSTTPSPAESNITLKRELPVTRAVRPLDPKTSLRIFPPTNLTARVTHEPIIHPIGDFNITMNVQGIMDRQKETHTRWRLRRMNWRLEETEKMISPACTRHASKVGGEGRGIAHEDTRTVGRDELKSGWKTDLSEGTIEMEFVVRPSRALCDVESPNGLVINHNLVIELIIAEEWAPNKNPEKATPTGAARVLRMQFAVMVTERSGMGISWDEEQPPMYEDVPASPPVYPAGTATTPDAAQGYISAAWGPNDIRNPYAGGSAPPGYPEAIAQPETPEMIRTRSEMMNYTGTPLGPVLEQEQGELGVGEEDFEGLSLGPARHAHGLTTRAGPRSRVSGLGSGGGGGSSRQHGYGYGGDAAGGRSSNLARSSAGLTMEDLEADDPRPRTQRQEEEEEEDAEERPPSPVAGQTR